jgi:hypothetical protein
MTDQVPLFGENYCLALLLRMVLEHCSTMQERQVLEHGPEITCRVCCGCWRVPVRVWRRWKSTDGAMCTPYLIGRSGGGRRRRTVDRLSRPGGDAGNL